MERTKDYFFFPIIAVIQLPIETLIVTNSSSPKIAGFLFDQELC